MDERIKELIDYIKMLQVALECSTDPEDIEADNLMDAIWESKMELKELSDWKYVGARYSDGDYVDPYDKESWELTGAKMVVVDGEKIKEDTYYRCIEGEIVEVTEDGEIVEE